MKLTQSYIKNYIITFFGGLFLVASFNFVVDPRKMFAVVNIKGFNSEKPFILNSGLRKLKSVEIEKGNFDTVLLGTSRVQYGLSPLHPIFGSSKAYNAGLAGTSIYEIFKAFKFANKQSNLKKVVLGLDAISFHSKKGAGGDYHQSKFSQSFNQLNFISSEIFSKDKILESFETITFNLKNKRDEYISSGFIKRNDSPESIRRELFINTIKEFLVREDLYPGLYDSPQRLELLKEIFNRRKDETKLYLFISPIHAYQLEGMKSINRFSLFEQWKRDLVQIIAEDAIANPNKQPIVLWDFSGYNSITTEKIPPAGSKKEMKWYWESSHYKKEVGDMVLDVMFNYPEKSQNTPSDFGVIINSNNIESHLERIRKQQALYKQNFPQEVEEVERLARETAHLRKASKTD
ncbi:MAG: hypothetical protein AAF757_28785 [Cyanobacteria bacterium P01_D01_bin.116]